VPYDAAIKYWKLLGFLAVSHGFATVFENISIVYISISLNQVIKATVPAGTLLASYLLEGKKWSRQLVASTCLIVFGAILCVFQNPEYNSVGVSTAFASAVLTVVQTLITAMLLQKAKLNPLVITLFISLFLFTLLTSLSHLIYSFFFTVYFHIFSHYYELIYDRRFHHSVNSEH